MHRYTPLHIVTCPIAPLHTVTCPIAPCSLEKLFAKVTPDDCNWSLDGDHIVITMEKAAAGRPWAGLVPLGSE